ncbi:MAG: bacteriohemerythrin [Ottowia sp.]|nr:bacteriohemerythrin [Ottowia sp.]
MDALQWNAALATGIPVIDEQHKQIVDMVNQLRLAIETGDTDAAGRIIPKMVDYTVFHFTFEEELMEMAGYNFLPVHRRVHQLFTKRIPEFQERHAAGEDILVELHNMLARWLAHHIQHEDRDYVPAIRTYLEARAQNAAAAAAASAAGSAAILSGNAAPAAATTQTFRKRGLWQRIKAFFTED